MKDTAIIWDLDGTLLDTLEDLCDSTNYALAQFGCPPRSPAEIRSFVGNGAFNQIRLSLPGREDDPPVEDVLKCYRDYYRDHCQAKTCPYPGVPEMLAKLKQAGYPMAVVSNKPDFAVDSLCREHFSGLLTLAMGEKPGVPRKPDPAMPLLAADAMGVPANRCIYVGDSEVDVRTARAAGMVCLSVTWGFRDEDVLRRAGADHFCYRVEELPAIIEKLESMIYGQ